MEELKGIKSWSEDDRPREKLVAKGALHLSDAELLAILIGSGNAKESAVDLSRSILKSVDGDLNKLSLLGIKELTRFNGIGQAKAVSIMAAMELSKRKRAQTVKDELSVNGSKVAYELFLQYMAGLKHEEFWVMCLNNSGKLLSLKKVSEGGLTATIVDPKRVFQVALEANSARIIIAHNHPSGLLSPSSSDQMLTNRLVQTAKLLDCKLDDHLIVTDAGYYSFADEGLLIVS